jgi:hypothetical protein
MTREEFFESIKLPYYAKIEFGGTGYYKVISEEEIIYVTDVVEHGIMVSPYYWNIISKHGVEITANEFEIKYIQALSKLKERI